MENGGLEIAGLESESGLEMGESMALSVLFQKGSIAEKIGEPSRAKSSKRKRARATLIPEMSLFWADLVGQWNRLDEEDEGHEAYHHEQYGMLEPVFEVACRHLTTD